VLDVSLPVEEVLLDDGVVDGEIGSLCFVEDQ
jgi:hypothetical protein